MIIQLNGFGESAAVTDGQYAYRTYGSCHVTQSSVYLDSKGDLAALAARKLDQGKQ
jgi:hypothetical protein